MREILEELFFGNINPNEQQFLRSTEYDKAMHILSESENKLTQLLDGKEKELLLALIKAQSTINATTALENFISGFRKGARIALEIMSDEDGCLRDIT